MTLVERLTTTSTDLLNSGRLDDVTKLDLAILQLRFIAEAMPMADRQPFLFQCWHHWSRGLTPTERIDLAEQAEKSALEVPVRIADLLRRPSLRRYSETMKKLLADGPANYTLFDYAQRAHDKLGVPVSIAALAARIVRGGQLADVEASV